MIIINLFGLLFGLFVLGWIAFEIATLPRRRRKEAAKAAADVTAAAKKAKAEKAKTAVDLQQWKDARDYAKARRGIGTVLLVDGFASILGMRLRADEYDEL